MLGFLKVSGIISSILVLIALAITFMKSLLALVVFLSGALKILIVLVFIALVVGIGLMIVKGWKDARRSAE